MVERTEVDRMAKFMEALNNPGATTPGNTVSAAPGMLGESVAEMKAILGRFHAATDQVVSEASYDRPLRESLAMERTEHGARIGNWEIVVNESGKRRYYDVINLITSEKIADNLMIYEAASGLARHLNDHGTVNATSVVEMLRAEQEFSGAVNDMVLYKHRLTKTPDSPRAGIFEARYGAAKRKALSARDRVQSIAERL
jgi:hypothetical protein